MDFWAEDAPLHSERDLRLFGAAARGQAEAVSVLVAEGADAGALVNGFNALHAAARKDHCAVLLALLAAHPQLAASRTADSRTALMLAAFEGHVASLRVLASHSSALVRMTDGSGNGALHYAVWGGHAEATRLLLECGADSSAPNAEGMLPVQLASAGDDLAMFLLLAGAEERSNSGCNSLHRACMYGALRIARHMLEELAADVHAPTAAGSQPLHLAAKGGHAALALLLLSRGADENARDRCLLTPLHLAALGGFTELARALIEAGADPRALSAGGSSPMHLAAAAGKRDVCRLLVDAGFSELFAKDSDGLTAIDLAVNSGFKDLASKIAMWSSTILATQSLLDRVFASES